MANDEPARRSDAPPNRVFDLEERTSLFAESVIDFLRTVPLTPLTRHVVDQLARCSTSVGANYCEADDAGTRKEVRYRISICRRESRETKFWLRMIARTLPERSDRTRELWREADELNRIFAAIHRRTQATTVDPPPPR